MSSEEIHMPEDPARFIQHPPIEVLLNLRTSKGEERLILAGRTTTPHLRPNGAIIVVRPQFSAGQGQPIKRGDPVRAHFKRTTQLPLDVEGVVSWVRARAFLPSGLAVSLVGVTFEWDAEEMALEIALFLANPTEPPEGGV